MFLLACALIKHIKNYWGYFMKGIFLNIAFFFLIVFCNPLSLFCIIYLSPLRHKIKALFKGTKKVTKSNKKLKSYSAIPASPKWIVVGREN